ncbi:long-chain-fatty-acid--AMP ligase FadD26-like [Benincasa hispida]|uniref:long-chain-fatty-acid--AMP ligase FadD26-like n=1 Tax=Benincasa hispida TaxID=102211 RepID=UPI00190254D2|nr:long-chain-fatty-acid--AMP ligase FadD26-like [Benincasa hispida]
MLYENFDPLFPDQPVVDRYLPVWASLPAFRSKPAFIWSEDGTAGSLNDGSFLTYQQLHDSVQFISDQLLRQLRRRDTVAVLCSAGLELVQLIYGCQRAGLVSVPISPPDPFLENENCHHLARALSQTKPRAAIAHQSYIYTIFRYLSSSPTDEKLALLLQSVQWISMDSLKQPDKKAEVNQDKHQPILYHSSSYYGCNPKEPYLIQYTSGATAIPKPVVVTAGAAAHNVRVARKAYNLNPNDVIVSWLPQYHDCGLMFLLLSVITGATCVLTSPMSFVTNPIRWLHLITAFKATCTPVPSFTLPLVLKRVKDETPSSKGLDLRSLRNLILINEPIYRAAVEEFVDEFKAVGLDPGCVSPSYGLAENCTFVSTAWSGGRRWWFPAMPNYRKLLPSGRLRDGLCTEIKVVVVNGETGEVVEDGVEGEIWVSSPSNASGYLGHPSLTKKTFHSKINNKSSPNFIRTGDRGVIRGADRFLFVIGRCSDLIKFNNTQQEIHPHYIESTAYNNSSAYLRGGCIAAVKISETIAVVAEMQRDDKNDAELLRKICEEIRKAVSIEEGTELGLVVLVKRGNIPKTTSGKVKRWAVKEKLAGGGLGVLMAIGFEKNCEVLQREEELRTRPALLSLL